MQIYSFTLGFYGVRRLAMDRLAEHAALHVTSSSWASTICLSTLWTSVLFHAICVGLLAEVCLPQTLLMRRQCQTSCLYSQHCQTSMQQYLSTELQGLCK